MLVEFADETADCPCYCSSCYAIEAREELIRGDDLRLGEQKHAQHEACTLSDAELARNAAPREGVGQTDRSETGDGFGRIEAGPCFDKRTA